MLWRAAMSRKKQWRMVLEREVRRWSSMPYELLVSALQDEQVYEVDFDSKKYQVEVEIVANTDHYLHIMVAVDDGSLPASLLPATDSFIRQKPGHR
jgi:hypothetical protein